VSEEVILSAKDIPGALECIEKEVDVLDEVMTGNGGTATAFMEARCSHVRVVNRPNFSLSPSDLIDILAKA
jgi:shikimate 5-dehydrogenase